MWGSGYVLGKLRVFPPAGIAQMLAPFHRFPADCSSSPTPVFVNRLMDKCVTTKKHGEPEKNITEEPLKKKSKGDSGGDVADNIEAPEYRQQKENSERDAAAAPNHALHPSLPYSAI